MRKERGLSLLDVYVHGREHEELYQLAELLTEWDERVGLWRYRHFQVVARIIGEDVVGTQGTPVELLAGLIKNRMFPELWRVRTELTELAKKSDPELIALDEIRRARERIADAVTRTPLVRLDVDAPCEIWLKLETLQPIGSFKLRGALSAVRAASSAELAGGVVTASAGNMAQGVAWAAREAGVHATIVAPDSAPRAKLDAVERLGGEIISVPHEVWWQTMVDRRYEGVDGLFVHPVEDDAVMAGNGTIGLELVEDLPAFDAVVIPWGGGGLTTGIASAVKALRPGTRVVTAEPATAAPLAASLAAGQPTEIDYQPSFVDGAGGRALLPDDVGPGATSSSTLPLRCPSTRSPPRCACSRRARGSSRRERARSRSPLRCAATPARAGSSASSAAATSTPPCCRPSSPARRLSSSSRSGTCSAEQ